MEEGTVVEADTRRRKASRPDTPEVEVGGLPTPAATPSTAPTTDPMSRTAPKPKADDPNQPILTPAHLKMIETLNSIPQLKKYRAYFPYVRNAHSVIIVRDPGVFPMHMDGMGVLEHWADRFVL